MSLFKVKEFWRHKCETDDERFDHKLLKLSPLNDDDDYIITGSHSGILRIFKPSTEYDDESGLLTGYDANDVVLEKEFDTPVLQIETGRFVSGSKSIQIVVLHPRLASVYSLMRQVGVADHGTQNYLTLMYEHKLKRSAANMVVGTFGGSVNRDFVCIQSLDGMLTFYEQECFAFCCFLSNFLIPGPLVYNKRTDSFVTFSSNWCIECYTYKRLSESGQNSDESDGNKAVCNWSYGLGEEIVDIKCVLNLSNNSKESFIAALGDRTVYCLNENGTVNFTKRFEYSPVCFNCYMNDDKLMLMVVSETRSILIYDRTTLKWSATFENLPVCIDRIFLKAIRGALCILTEDGLLQLGYLGTQPNLFTAPPVLNKPLNFEKADEELRTLTTTLKRNYNNDVKLTNSNAEREMVITIKVSPHVVDEEVVDDDENVLYQSNRFESRTCKVIIDVLPQALFEELHLSVTVRKPLTVRPESRFFTNLSDRTEVICNVYLKENDDDFDLPSLELAVVASFVTNLGVPKVLRKSSNLPLHLVMDTCAAVKDNENKIILNINKNLVPLSTLFPEFAGENSLGMNSNVVAFKRYKNDSANPITILTAKSSQRYRLQCDSIGSMSIMVEEMIRRLKSYYKEENDLEITHGTQLPSDKILDCIREHYETRKVLVQLEQELYQISAQFRLIQKRLISKFKNKNPTSLSHLEMLLKDTNDEIMRICDRIVAETRNLDKSQINVSCCLNLIVSLIRLSDNDNQIDLTAFESIFLPCVYDLETQNWEDVVDAGLCYVLRTVLAKSEKDRLRAAHTSFDEVKDLSKFEKHFVAVIERLTSTKKKGSLINDNANQEELPDINVEESEDVEENEKQQLLIPIGSQIGGSSSRALSARRSLLQRRNRVVEEN